MAEFSLALLSKKKEFSLAYLLQNKQSQRERIPVLIHSLPLLKKLFSINSVLFRFSSFSFDLNEYSDFFLTDVTTGLLKEG